MPRARSSGHSFAPFASSAAVLLGAAAAHGQYVRRDLVSDQAGAAEHQDTGLVNAWGLVFNPTAYSWVNSADGGTSRLYDGNGVQQSLVVDVPSPTAGTGGAPTGIIYNGGSDFMVSGGGTGPARFVFAGEDGVISGWSPAASPTQAIRVVDNSAGGAIYKGLAMAATPAGSRLYATDFHNARVDVFDGAFAPAAGAFNDPNLPAGYAPFNARTINNQVFVTYAVQDATGEDDVPGPGNGIVDVFNTDGTLSHRFATGGALNSPWGMALAPADFGAFSNALLVGNFGDGRINAYDVVTGAPLGPLTDASGAPIEIDGLWGIEFGNGFFDQPMNTLFFTAGPDDESHGLYGRLDLAPTPGALSLLGIGLGVAARRRRRA